MKTKQFIKMLQEADPSGEGFIRMPYGIPVGVECKEGYWDGPYTYLDENQNHVLSINGYKVDIHTMELDDYIDRFYEKGDTWESFKDRFKFELGSYVLEENRNERKEAFLKNAKKCFEEHIEIIKEIEEKYGNTNNRT